MFWDSTLAFLTIKCPKAAITKLTFSRRPTVGHTFLFRQRVFRYNRCKLGSSDSQGAIFGEGPKQFTLAFSAPRSFRD